MKRGRMAIKLLLAAMICLVLGACGTGDEGLWLDEGGLPAQSANVSVKTGAVATDSWGYSGSSAIQLMAPSQAGIVMQEHTLLQDASRAVVTGDSFTRVSYSTDLTTLSSTARASAPANFVCYLDIFIGAAKSAAPALSVTLDVGAVAPGQTVTLYNYDAGTGRWTSAQTAVVNGSGKVTFQAGKLSLWGVFR